MRRILACENLRRLRVKRSQDAEVRTQPLSQIHGNGHYWREDLWRLSYTESCMADGFEQRLELKSRFCSVPKRILIADDHESVLRRIRAMLQDDPVWEICGDAVDGREAVEKAAKLEPDLVILDFAMPRLNGLQAASEIRKLLPGVPIVMFTLYGSQIKVESQKQCIFRVVDKTKSQTLVPALKELLGMGLPEGAAAPIHREH
jgi:CheY-like chemotaxis protein